MNLESLCLVPCLYLQLERVSGKKEAWLARDVIREHKELSGFTAMMIVRCMAPGVCRSGI